ncbi:hypothetical protein [Vulcanisaeta souniana]|uniref:Uncharacterized protein n=1 Tax=Vulcanisaeta souniana JCM 11219 TaxID=1293586 RepID=A0A830E501_9CREN|nr:hypothetical protein [Vulcanisaeta souniana]BDR91611.1 hypothetical protein Vsou_07040 [Vulcanisaeta souniana JCM 11219]GGI71907.1 hypothetical protein GCM10007112_05880 [Vulcanisaeta souniana JCM 11219]
MNALEVLVRIKRIAEDMIKETFIVKAIKENSILSLSTEDIIELYPYNAYDYRIDGKNIDYVITEDAVALLADLAKINNWAIDNIRYAEFNDCISIGIGEGTLSITCKDKHIYEGERVVYLDKTLLRKYGVNIRVKPMDGEPLMPLEKVFENPTSIIIESLINLPLYFVINPAHLGLEILADSYIHLLSKGLNRVPTNTDAADYLISVNKLSEDIIKVYVLRKDLELLRDYFDVSTNEKDNIVEYIINGNPVLAVSIVQGSINQDLLRVTWIDLESFRINGIGINLIDLGSTNILDCARLLIDKMREEFHGIL